MRGTLRGRVLALITSFALVLQMVPVPQARALSEDASFKLALRYYDRTDSTERTSEAHPTTDTIGGIVYIEPEGFSEDATNVQVAVRIPKAYIQEGSVKFAQVEQVGTTQARVGEVTQEGDDYLLPVTFDTYDKTSTLSLRFEFKWQEGMVPTDWVSEVGAQLTYGGRTQTVETPLRYTPTYDTLTFSKGVYANAVDGEGGEFTKNPGYLEHVYLEEDAKTVSDGQLVAWGFRVNTNPTTGVARTADSITITDTLPAGVTLAEASEQNGWSSQAGPDGRVVATKTYVGHTVENDWGSTYVSPQEEIEADRIVVDVSGIKLDEYNATYGQVKLLTNSAQMTAVPAGKSEGEQSLTLEASHSINLVGSLPRGSFIKRADKASLIDTLRYRSQDYKWTVSLTNSSVGPNMTMGNIVIYDTPSDVSRGLDERLRFTGLGISYASGHYEDLLGGYVLAHLDDGSTKRIELTSDMLSYWTSEMGGGQVGQSRSIGLTFDESDVVAGWELHLPESFKLASQTRNVLVVVPTTVFRDKETPAYDADDEGRNVYRNEAGVHATFDSGLEFKYSYEALFTLIAGNEPPIITKENISNAPNKNDKPGDTFTFRLRNYNLVPNTTATPTVQVVDLLGPSVSVESVQANLIITPDFTYDVIYNYKGSGRTAVVFEMTSEQFNENIIESKRDTTWSLATIVCSIDEPGLDGTYENDVYLWGPNLAAPEGDDSVVDELDINGNGSTTDRIAHASATYYVQGNSSEYAYKTVRSLDTDNPVDRGWSRTGIDSSLAPGTKVEYKLGVQNADGANDGLVIYDVLPSSGDMNIHQTRERGSAFDVRLTGPVSLEGYTAWYTTSDEVYAKTMAEAVGLDIWQAEPDDWSSVTAFKLVANEGVGVRPYEAINVIYEAEVRELSGDDLARAQELARTDTYDYATVQAVNGFGFSFASFDSPKQSNEVYVRQDVSSPDKVKLTVRKEWLGDPADSVTFDVYKAISIEEQYGAEETLALIGMISEEDANPLAATVTLTAKDGWETTLELPVVDEKWGISVIYSVVERPQEGYETTLSGDLNTWNVTDPQTYEEVPYSFAGKGKVVEVVDDMGNGETWTSHVFKYDTSTPSIVTLSNYNAETTSLKVQKRWVGAVAQDKVSVRLLADDVALATVDLTKEASWEATFNGLPVFSHDDGHRIEYTVEELDKIDGYSTRYEAGEDGALVVTNCQQGKVVVRYEDREGNELLDPQTDTDAADFGTEYDTDDHKPETIQAQGALYEWVAVKGGSASEQGTIDKPLTTVTYVYDLARGRVNVQYLVEDLTGTVVDTVNKLFEMTHEGLVGDEYSTEELAFKDYDFSRMADDSAPTSGTFQTDEQTVTYIYRQKAGRVVVHYLSEDGETIKDDVEDTPLSLVGTEYDTSKKSRPERITTSDGRTFERVPEKTVGTESGTVVEGTTEVTYVYRLVTGSVTVEHVTEGGEVLSAKADVKRGAPVGEAYATKEGSFEGYEFVRMGEGSAPASGTVREGEQAVVYVYRKVSAPGPEPTPEPEPEPDPDPAEPGKDAVGRVIVHYVNEAGATIKDDVVDTPDSPVGTAYDTAKSNRPVRITAADGRIYEIISAKTIGSEQGKVVEGTTEVTYVYSFTGIIEGEGVDGKDKDKSKDKDTDKDTDKGTVETPTPDPSGSPTSDSTTQKGSTSPAATPAAPATTTARQAPSARSARAARGMLAQTGDLASGGWLAVAAAGGLAVAGALVARARRRRG